MYLNPFDVYKIYVEGARKAFKVAKDKTINFYENDPPADRCEFKDADLKFMATIDTAIKKLEEGLRLRNAMQLNDDLATFFYIMSNISQDLVGLYKTRFSYEYLQASQDFLTDPKLKEFKDIQQKIDSKKTKSAKPKKKAAAKKQAYK